jgi:hypothetical protein
LKGLNGDSWLFQPASGVIRETKRIQSLTISNVGVMWMLGYEVYPEGVFNEESWNKLRNWFGKLNLKFKESTQ